MPSSIQRQDPETVLKLQGSMIQAWLTGVAKIFCHRPCPNSPPFQNVVFDLQEKEHHLKNCAI